MTYYTFYMAVAICIIIIYGLAFGTLLLSCETPSTLCSLASVVLK